MRKILIVAVLSVLPLHAASQPGQASLEGRVVRYNTNEPIANARVTIGKSSVAPTTIPFQNWLGPLTIAQTEMRTVTDAQGRFSFHDLESGDYIVVADADGYRNLAVFPGGPPEYSAYAKRFTLRSGERQRDMELSLITLATVRGTVRDAGGKAVSGIDVLIGTIEYSGGHRRWNQAETVQTNENGEFQFRGLEPREYYVVATREPYTAAEFELDETKIPSMATYFPQALSIASATPISLMIGSDVRADIKLATKPTNRRTISGKVMPVLLREPTPLGFVPAPGSISLIPRGDNSILNSPVPHPSASISASGEFEIRDVEPGAYDLYVHALRWPRMYLGQIGVIVTDRDLTGLSVTLDRTGAGVVRGRIMDESGPILRPIAVRLEARAVIPFFEPFLSGLNNGLAPPAPNPAEFTFTNVPPGDYDLRIFPPTGTYVADIRQGGKSIFDSGLAINVVSPEQIDVILRHDGGAVNVRLLGDRGRSGLLVLVPNAPRRNIHSLYQDINVTAPTSYTFEDVRPGNYKVFAIESWLYDPYQGAYLSEDYLAKYEDLGIPVVVRDSATTNAQLNLARK